MRSVFLVCKKEFLELSKDKRTLFLTFFLPVLLYPAIFFMVASLGRSDSRHRLGTPSRLFLADPAGILEARLRARPGDFTLVPEPAGGAAEALRDRRLDLAVEVDASAVTLLQSQETFTVRARMDASDAGSELALERLKTVMEGLDAELVARRLEALGAPAQLANPSRIAAENVAGPELEAGKVLGSFLPYVLLLMMFQGAMQHGIHTTAGEKERGTLQSLLATPLPRSSIIWGKLLYIFSMGLVAAILNLLSMGLSLALVAGTGGSRPVEQASVLSGHLEAMTDPGVLALGFLMLVPLGLLFAGFILFMGIRARSTAEAGTSLMPGLFLIVTLGAFSLAPGIERMAVLPYVPILNATLAIRKMFSQQGNPLEFAIAFAMTSALAALATWASTRLLDRESALFRQG